MSNYFGVVIAIDGMAACWRSVDSRDPRTSVEQQWACASLRCVESVASRPDSC